MKWIIVVVMLACRMVQGQEEPSSVPVFEPLMFLMITEGQINSTGVLPYIPTHGKVAFEGTMGKLDGNTIYATNTTGMGKEANYRALEQLTASDDMSVSLWVNDGAADGQYYYISYGDPITVNGGRWTIVRTAALGGTVSLYIDNQTQYIYAYATNVTSKAGFSGWHHWVAVYNGATRDATFYHNGALWTFGTSIYLSATPAAITSTYPVVLNAQRSSIVVYNGQSPALKLGMIEVVKRKLTHGEIQQLYAYGIGRYIK